MKKTKTHFFLYLLGGYVALQFIWWGYLLIQFNAQLEGEKNVLSQKVLMIIGEGLVFFLILLLGFGRIVASMKREQVYSERQKNFMLSVTHELKTPIASIKLFLQTLQKRNLSEEKKNEFISKALADNERLQEIVESILVATQIDNQAIKTHREIFLVNDLLNELKDHYNHLEGKETIEFISDSNVKINADIFMIKTIFRNLIENSLKYGNEGDKIILFLDSGEDYVKMGVKDFGEGIAKEFQDDIFKKFYRIENEETRNKKGTGLGLFIAHEFARLSGGKLSYYPNIPSGSVFELTLY